MAKKSKKCGDRAITGAEAAITRHLATLSASSVTLAAHTSQSGECDDEIYEALSDAESDALKDVAESPCASDAEFIEKLRYLFAVVGAEGRSAGPGMLFERWEGYVFLARPMEESCQR